MGAYDDGVYIHNIHESGNICEIDDEPLSFDPALHWVNATIRSVDDIGFWIELSVVDSTPTKDCVQAPPFCDGTITWDNAVAAREAGLVVGDALCVCDLVGHTTMCTQEACYSI